MASETKLGDVFDFKKPVTELRVPELPYGLMKPPAGLSACGETPTNYKHMSTEWMSRLTLSASVEADFSALRSRTGSTSTPSSSVYRRSMRHSPLFKVFVNIISQK